MDFPCPSLLINLSKPKLLPGRKPIIQLAERLPLKQSQNIDQSKMRSKGLIPKGSKITNGSGYHDKVIPISDYTIPQCQNVIQFLE